MNERIKEILANVFEVTITEINADSSPDTIETWDSLKHMNMILALEDEFGVKFDDEDIINMVSFELICLILKNKI